MIHHPLLRGAVLAAALTASAPALAQPSACATPHLPGTVRLDVSATQIRSGNGEVAFTLYPDDRRRFLAKGGKLARARVPAHAGVTEACFWVRPGYYAATIYHDEDGDRKFDRILFMPKEGAGASNDPPGTLLPKFETVRFAVPAAGRSMPIRMRYPR